MTPFGFVPLFACKDALRYYLPQQLPDAREERKVRM